MNELETNRAALLEKTEDLLSLILQRKKIVTNIQKFKETDSLFKNFDPQREVFVFKNLKSISKLNMIELLSLSLIIESQAGGDSHYPAWSSGEHLEPQLSSSIEQQINPILLATLYPKSYHSLPLKKDFKQAIEKALEIK